ncbi:cyclodeaminase/cyclohydrolase family protein [Alkalicella caledoniensis]|uniref:Cyclodeaminase/cyclohydrolase family protein n=1 Tax=Alkalicella caledoniensis TaxID=2731377 RepID=A0A7G9WBS0_ALKCA|nr:cyclodeaminase/cyclohydrolase family protein [Alkalicella caledoniensis]QNO16132.1 cyclodeaminase/cyclohydrolase family protein [Alkalicella caledoniensis]
MFKDLTVEEFLQNLGEGSATPGGGTAAAISGAMGASLISMFCRVTAGRKKYAEIKGEMEKIASEVDKWREKLIKLADEDSNSYIEVMNAFKLPKDTEEEKSIRAEKIEVASQRATEVPFETAIVILPILEKVSSLANKGNPNAISDLKVGLELCHTGFIGAISNVEINLPTLNDKEFSREIKEKMMEAQVRAQKAVDEGRESIFNIFEQY